MAFPQTALPVEVALLLGGVWTDITADVYSRDEIKIRRGRSAEGKAVDPAVCELTLDNRTGKYSPRNPLSPYYGLIGRNTPLRVAVYEGTPYLDIPADSYGATADDPALDITGDLDIRLDLTLDSWASDIGLELAGKYALIGGDQRSWFILSLGEHLTLRWSADGATTLQLTSTMPLPPVRRRAIRITLDVDNGAAGHTATFYSAPTIDGPWTPLGDPVTGSGTTSVFSSTAPVQVGNVSESGFDSASGKIHVFELRDGIDGTVVANPDWTAQTPGDTSFVDDAGRTWTLGDDATITNRKVRFHGEVASWPARWGTGGFDVWAPIEAAGILRRLGQGAKALESTLRRRIPSYGPLAYWPMEDGDTATQGASPIPGVAPLTLTPARWASEDSLLASAPLPVVDSTSSARARLSGAIPTADPLTEWSVSWMYRLDSVPAARETFMQIKATGTIRQWRLKWGATGSTIEGYDDEGTLIINQGVSTGSDLFNQWCQAFFSVVESAGICTYRIAWVDVGGSGGTFSDTYAGTCGNPTTLSSPPGGFATDLDGMAIGHISVWPTDTADAYLNATTAWAGETAGERMQRLAEEESVPVLVAPGYASDLEEVGAQRPSPLLTLLQDAADVDGGILHEDRDSTSLIYRDHISLYNQTPALVLDYTGDDGLVAPLDPVDDDQQVRNDVTVKREGGSSGRATLTEGALSTASPPDGVGRYDETVTLNLHTDDQTSQAAGWLLHLGTWDEARYPLVTVNLAGAPASIDAATGVDLGDRVQITNPPAWLPPDTIDLMVQGYTETINQYTWTITYNCSPAGPWDVAWVGSSNTGVLSREFVWADTAGCELAEALTTTETAVDVLTTVGPLWVTANPSLIVNPDFETDLDGWFGSGSTISRVLTPEPQPFDGQWSLKMVPDGVAQFPNAGSDAVPVVVGQQYIASGWLRSATTRTLGLNTNWFSAGSTYLSTDSNDVAMTAGVWSWFEKTVTAPATAVTANLAATVADFPPVTDILWAEGLTLRPVGGSPFEFPFRVRAGGEVMTVNACTSAVVDGFGRTEANGWGTADSGQAWTVVGAAADYAVGSGYASATLPTTGIAHLTLLTAPHADTDLIVDVATSALATGASLMAGPCARMVDNNNHYMARIEFDTSGGLALTLRKRVAGVETILATHTSALTHTAGTFYRVRLQVFGSELKARLWGVADVEPSIWHCEDTDGDLTAAASVGTRCFSVTGNTNVNPAVRYDNFEITNPQTMTVDRSVNTVVKAQTAGTDIRLAHPPTASL